MAGVARRCQLSVGRSELVGVLSPVERRQRFLDRRRDQIGDRQIPIFRQDLGEVGEGLAQLIQLIGGIGPVLLAPGETKLDVTLGCTTAVIRSPRAAGCCAVARLGTASVAAAAIATIDR